MQRRLVVSGRLGRPETSVTKHHSTLRNIPEEQTSYSFVCIGLTLEDVLSAEDVAFNPLAPNDIYISRTAQLTSRRCILNIYSTNILTEYFKHAAHSLFFFLSSRCRLFHNAIFFGSCNIHILYTECAKILKKIPRPKG